MKMKIHITLCPKAEIQRKREKNIRWKWTIVKFDDLKLRVNETSLTQILMKQHQKMTF